MVGRNLLGLIATSGILAAVGYLLIPRRRNRFALNLNRLPFSLRDIRRWANISRKLIRAVAR
ncbi:hypothetical protein [Brevibacillus sp. H7]|uniref:hypothetical protein n=1 Tax=Brevibacillus sp. H7 TaxID=3349138 RepID=UPI003809ED15